MKKITLELSKIRCDSGTQSRLGINDETVGEYSERMVAGDQFPAMDVFFDGTEYHLADGFHRYMAASRNRVGKFECVVHSGTATDALWFALGANKSNGMRMTSGDKRKAIELALAKFPDKTQEAIAAHVGCSQQYVAKVQSELTTSGKLKAPATRKGKDGKSRKTSYKKREPEPAQSEASSEDDIPFDDVPSPASPPPAQPDPSVEFVKRVEREFHRFMDKFAASEMPAVRAIIRPFVMRS